ncbi:MAG: hypothetical protein JNM84_11270 [Planctomycetes bacterium]|nr:hypothetical protein [Planctomycetota bacterium]
MLQPRKTASHVHAARSRADRGVSTVGASWFVLLLLLTLFCFAWYIDSSMRMQDDSRERLRQDQQLAARKDRTEYEKAKLKALSQIIGVTSALPTLPGAADDGGGSNASRVKDLKTFAADVAKYAQPIFDRGAPSSKHKPDFYLKRVLDEDGMVPPKTPVLGVTYDEEAYRAASDRKTAGLAVMTELRKLFSTPFGGETSDAKNATDGEMAIKFRDLRAQWETLYDAVARNVNGDDAIAEQKAIDATRTVGAGDAWAPTISLLEIVQQISIKYADLQLDTERLRAAWEIAQGGVEAPENAAWNDLRRAARVLQTGDKAGWDQVLAEARRVEREALKTALGAAYGAAGVGDEQVDAFVAARRAQQPAELVLSMLDAKAPEAASDVTPKPFAPLGDDESRALEAARRDRDERDAEMRRVESQLGWTEGKERIGRKLDLHVDRLAQIERYGRLSSFFTEKLGSEETYSYSTEGYRSYLTERANALKSGLQRVLEGLRSEASAFDERYAATFAANAGLPADLYTDPNERKTASVGGEAKDTAEAYALPFGAARGASDLDTVVKTGIGDLSKVVELAKAETAALDAKRSGEIEPATQKTEKSVRDRGQRLGGLLVSDSIETVFPDVAKGQVLQAPPSPVSSVRVVDGATQSAVAFIDLDAGDNLRPGVSFFVVEPLPLGAKRVKAVAVVDRIGAEGEPSRVQLAYMPGIDPLTHAVVRGDLIENAVFNANYRRNVVIVAPDGESYSALAVQDILGKLNFSFQDAIDENTDMVILTGSRRDSLRAMAPTEEGEGGDEKPWFQENPLFQEAERRGLNVFFFEDDVRVRVPSVPRLSGGAR